MVEVIAVLATIPALYALWIVGRVDLLRFLQGVRHVRATVVRHELGSDGFVPVYRFEDGGSVREVHGMTAHASPQPPQGSSQPLSYPRRRPDLARPPQTFPRILLYSGFAAWIGLFGDMLFNWF